jgi:maltose-binding protein MalE
MNALGDRIQATAIPHVGERQLTLANPEGEFMTSSCKEREAALEFLAFLSNGPHNKWLSTDRGYLPVRKSRAADPAIQANRFFKLAMANAANWWTPPFSFKNWANYQDKIAPYWQQALRQEITAAQWNTQAAKFLRGQA